MNGSNTKLTTRMSLAKTNVRIYGHDEC